MFSVVEIDGKQHVVRVGDTIEVDQQSQQELEQEFDVAPLLVSDDSGEHVEIGTPFVEEKKVRFRVLDHFKGKKIRVFKMKSKKRYARTKWFRPHKTRLEVMGVA